MKITQKQLLKYVENISVDIEILTRKGIEVNQVIGPSEHLKQLRIVKIQDVVKHPERADLNLVSFEDSTVVCGDLKLQIGDRCVVIEAGQILPLTGKKLRPRKVAGVESNKMLCSALELGGTDDNGVLIVPNDVNSVEEAVFPEGMIYDVEITYNRGDLLSVRGFAKELVMLGMARAKEGFDVDLNTCFESIDANVENVIVSQLSDKNMCKFYSFSQFKSLKTQGLVELSNRLMIDTGQPMHVFDLDELRLPIVIRLSAKDEEFTDLKGNKHCLPEGLLVIADQIGVIALAGVIGGWRGRVSMNTVNIGLEIAHFAPAMVSQTVQMLEIYTKAANFFIHGVDISYSGMVLKEFEMESGRNADEIAWIGSSKIEVNCIEFDLEMGRKLCMNWSDEIFFQTMQRIGCKIATEQNGPIQTILVTPPYGRLDLQLPVDLISEFVRLNGYKEVVQELFLPNAVQQSKNSIDLTDKYHQVKHLHLVNNSTDNEGKNECVNEVNLDVKLNKIMVDNPMSGYHELRESLMPQLIELAENNVKRSRDFTGFYEVGLVFKKHEEEYLQCKHIAVVSKEKMEGILRSLRRVMGGIEISFKPIQCKGWKHASMIIYKRVEVGIIGQLEHNLKYNIELVGFELFQLDFKGKNVEKYVNYHTIYHRDFTIVTDALGSDIIRALRGYSPRIIDCYPCHILGQKKSITVRCYIKSEEVKTSEELGIIMSKLDAICSQFL